MGKGNSTNPHNLYDTSVKVPAIFSQPGRIQQGVVSSALVSGYDFMPTILEYAGIDFTPEEKCLGGASFLFCMENLMITRNPLLYMMSWAQRG